MRRLRLLAGLLAVGLLAGPARALPPAKTVTVAADGSGDFREVQAAIDSAPDGGLLIQIKPGVYHQVLTITAPHIELRGLGQYPREVLLTFCNSHGTAGGTGKSASVTVTGDDFRAENLTIENSFSRDHPEITKDAQAVALYLTGDRAVVDHVRLLGAQDTLYAASKSCHSEAEIAAAKPCRASRQYFHDCYIAGHVDFIFGDAKAVFDHCELHAVAHAVVTITAQSRVYPAEDSGYLFRDCTVTAEDGIRSLLLGRSWRAYATVIWIGTDFKAKLDPVGWAEWDGKLKTSTYAEFGSHGQAGDLKQRIAPARELTPEEAAQDTTAHWLAGWNPGRPD
jgi:pectin methylesterase-like acyl-CoA thioesterase